MAEPGTVRAPGVALFRLEFGGRAGWGHLVRSGALAAELRRRGWRCDLWTDSSVDAVPAELRDAFDGLRRAAGSSHVPAGCDWLVIDHYGTSDDDIAAWRAGFSGGIVAMDDDRARTLASADLVVNPRLGLAESPYASGVKALLGERYALVRPAFRSPIRPQWLSPSGTTPVLVMLGGTDPAGATSEALHALADVDAAGMVPLVVHPGQPAPCGAAREAFARFAHAQWLGSLEAGRLAGWMAHARFAISAAGGSLYELAVVGVPFVSIVVADNQRGLAEAARARWGMPSVVAGPGLRHELAQAIAALRIRLANTGAASPMIDGRGAERVADVMSGRAD